MKKAQVTLFIIMGIVALFAVGFLLYYLENQSNRPAPAYNDVAPIKTYVESCISKLSNEAFEYIGKQGGVIYISQGGTYAVFDTALKDKSYSVLNVPGVDYNVPYAITRYGDGEHYVGPNPPQTESPYWGGPNEYPWIYFPYTPFLVPDFNSNAVYGAGPYGYSSQWVTLNIGDGGPTSIQEETEAYIEKHLKECTNNFIDFPEYSIDEKEVKATVLFAEADTVISVSYPLELTKKAGGSGIKLSDFLVRKPVRMKKIYEVANWIINKDVSNVKYDIAQDTGMLYTMLITPSAIDPTDNIGTFITISDEFSQSNGIPPYTFTFARQNRRPALEYITDPKNLPVPPITPIGILPPKGPKGCIYGKEKSTVNCEFGWHTVIYESCCGCEHFTGPGECICSPCCKSKEEYHPSAFTITESMFSDAKIAEDPDEDDLTNNFYFKETEPCTTLPCKLSYPDIYPDPLMNSPGNLGQNPDITLYVKDPVLEDYQTVHFIISWKNCGKEGYCCFGDCKNYEPQEPTC